MGKFNPNFVGKLKIFEKKLYEFYEVTNEREK